ncbi:sensor histidine kinase [Francisella philomiragia]|uniref:Histidine kinase-, DNA gyrase B-, and HSP90-like ATPase family protein n=1 Tax=Francisella philomiragia TaxID=28110 RepID=A0A0B6D763_9GAMM|nr:sensor histidine kinase [Francisella philomiragia]AJI53473.1 histidine kinase-, DNA gyrase B-, and HSP90-like ATPase family protein [Francisella philomiragia]
MKKEKLSFQVAAKTARLIGRESIASAEGAVIELVKNSYDADSSKCHIYLYSEYDEIPVDLLDDEYNKIKKITLNSDLLDRVYSKSLLGYKLKNNIDKKDKDILESIFSYFNSIIIYDNGEGMSSDIIKTSWMTIGTNFKEISYKSAQGRVRSGAKGIGRFALDRLGRTCKMFTKKAEKQYCQWFVDWEDFEEKETLNQVEAILDNEEFCFKNEIPKIFNIQGDVVEYNSGTLICINNLREFWTKQKINKLFNNLKSLLPPSEEKKFEIFLYSNKYSEGFGKLSYDDYKEYDWKMDVSVKKGIVNFTFYPDEYNKTEFRKNFFHSSEYKQSPIFSEEEYQRGSYSIERTIDNLLPIEPGNRDFEIELNNIGDFDFSFIFMKKTMTAKDQEKYLYKPFVSTHRTEWIKQNGGIKLYRDGVRVRPYGIGQNFDWLKLDQRAAGSPAAPSRKGDWRVRSHQVSGVVHISREKNVYLNDQSNREALIENNSFEIFKKILESCIEKFEEQRSTVASILNEIYKKKNEEELILEESNSLIDGYNEAKEYSREEIETLFKRARIQNNRIEDLELENKLLRVLASSGAMVAAFTHDFQKISDNLLNRHLNLRHALKHIDQTLFSPNFDPFQMIDLMEEQDKKLGSWLSLSINTLKKDRRSKKSINLNTYFRVLKNFWEPMLSERRIVLEAGVEDIYLECYEVDLDSIFYNLITNSCEAFTRIGFKGDKIINITVSELTDRRLEIIYEDSGPGLLGSISQKQDILKALYTTKKDNVGNAIGTGLGMTIVDNSVHEMKGLIEILSFPGRDGFRIKIDLPIR